MAPMLGRGRDVQAAVLTVAPNMIPTLYLDWLTWRWLACSEVPPLSRHLVTEES